MGMAFVTYVLLVGCFKGFVKQNFNVEDLLVIQSWGIFLWVFESLLQKGFLYFFNIANPPFCELLAYTGYKYVIMCVLVLGNLGLGTYGFYALLVLFGGLFMLFFYRTMVRFVHTNTLADHIKQVSMNKQTFLFANCGLQVFL